MPFLRLTRDQRGYENTFLLHAAQPGERPRVLYWYRSAPGVRVGRPALDEDAIRAIEEQHPDIEFDWVHILEAATMLPPEVDHPSERLRRKPSRPREERPAASTEPMTPTVEPEPGPSLEPREESTDDMRPLPTPPARGLLEELVGLEIATRLRARYAEIASLIQRASDQMRRDTWRSRADAINPDGWATPAEVLHGIQHADVLFDELRHEIMKLE